MRKGESGTITPLCGRFVIPNDEMFIYWTKVLKVARSAGRGHVLPGRFIENQTKIEKNKTAETLYSSLMTTLLLFNAIFFRKSFQFYRICRSLTETNLDLTTSLKKKYTERRFSRSHLIKENRSFSFLCSCPSFGLFSYSFNKIE